jgi:CRP/FNR family transcriptional regulator, cyclic AMP receptor protein
MEHSTFQDGHDGAVRLLDVAPQLAEHLPEDQARAARAAVLAPTIELRRGPWDRERICRHANHPFGAIVVSGLLTRTVDVGGYPGLDLHGPGDVIGARDLRHNTLPCGESWAATVPSRIALLDDRFLLAARRWPRLVSATFELLAEQRDRLMMQLVIAEQPRVEDRLLMLFWQLADRFGKVTPEGITIQLALTHEALGRLIGARRPTVTLALRMLGERGAVERRPDRSWIVKELPQDTAVTAAVLSDGTQPRPLEPEPVSSPS